jgi:hypothetical protein
MKINKYPSFLLPSYMVISAGVFFDKNASYASVSRFIKSEGVFSSIIKINENHNVHIKFKGKRAFSNENT